MLSKIKAFLSGEEATVEDEAEDPMAAAAAALLVEAAMTDGDFDGEERGLIIDLLHAQFDVSKEEADALVADVENDPEHTNRLYSATKIIRDAYDEEQRIDILEMLWRVAYADGVLHDYEANLVRRVAGLLYVRDQDSGRARKRAMAAVGAEEE